MSAIAVHAQSSRMATCGSTVSLPAAEQLLQPIATPASDSKSHGMWRTVMWNLGKKSFTFIFRTERRQNNVSLKRILVWIHWLGDMSNITVQNHSIESIRL